MTVRRLDHAGLVVTDLPAAVEFFTALGLEASPPMSLHGPVVDALHGLAGVRTEIVYLRTPDGQGAVEVTRYDSPPPVDPASTAPSTTGLRSLMFEVSGLDSLVDRLQALGHPLLGEIVAYEDSYRLAYVHGPAGAVVALAEPMG